MASDELIARLYEDLDELKAWLKAHKLGEISGRMRNGVWEDTSAADAAAYERLKEHIRQTIQRLEEEKAAAKRNGN